MSSQGLRTQVWQLDTQRVDRRRIQEAASLLFLGKVIVLPTETVYGMAALSSRPEAVERVYEIKDRSRDKPLSWHVADYDYLNSRGVQLSSLAREISWRFLPGPITLIVNGPDNQTIGLRFPDHAVARALIQEVGEAVLATSVNRSGEEPAASGKRAARMFDGQVDLVLDCGVTRYGTESTIVDLTKSPPAFIRKGPLAQELEQFLEGVKGKDLKETERILFVCSGNTCRSVMAAGWLGAEIKRRGMDYTASVASCGTNVLEGAPATLEAIQTVRDAGAEISGHKARSITKKLLQDATRIFAMSAHHVDAIVQLDHDMARKVTVLGIRDPLGMDLQVYKQTLNEMQEKLKGYLTWLSE